MTHRELQAYKDQFGRDFVHWPFALYADGRLNTDSVSRGIPISINRDTYGEDNGIFDFTFDTRGLLHFTIHIAKRGAAGHLDYQIQELFNTGISGPDQDFIPAHVGNLDWVTVADHQDIRLSDDGHLSSVYNRNLTHGITAVRVRFRSLSTDIPRMNLYFHGGI